MKIGFEQEFFLHDKDGRVLFDVPTTLPFDDGGHLVEARSAAHTSPDDVQRSLSYATVQLRLQALQLGFHLHLAASHDYGKRIKYGLVDRTCETAGFHVHFDVNDAKLRERICTEMDAKFAFEIAGAGRTAPSGDSWRAKPYGFEYRMLPATIDVNRLTAFLQERLGEWK